MVMAASSTEYIHIDVTATPAGTDLTSAPVRIAVIAHRDNPSESEWHTATWDGDTAFLLVGPDGGAVTLTRGDYSAWINVDPPGAENIVRRAGTLSIV